MSIAEEHHESGLHIWPVEEAVAHARPLPPVSDLVVDGATPEEWAAFHAALAEV